MAVIKVPGPISGKAYTITISGDSPNVDEQKKIDAFVSQREQAFQTKYAQRFGAPIDTGESTGVGNYVGEIGKGLARGAVNLGESATLGLASLLPESWETPAREYIRRGAYEISPQADIGLEDSAFGTVSEGVGSIAPIYAASLIPVAGPVIAGALAVGAGAGEASERARAAGATLEQRNSATRKGAVVGALDLIPVFGSVKKFLGPTASNKIVNYVLNLAMEGGEEAAQEATTEVLQNMIQQGYDPDQDLGEGTLEAAGIGGIAGALVAAILPGRTRTGAPEAETDAPPAAPPAGPLLDVTNAGAEGPDDGQEATIDIAPPGAASVVATTAIKAGNTATTTVTLNDGSKLTIPGTHNKNSPLVKKAVRKYNESNATEPRALTDEERAARDAAQETMVAGTPTPPKATAEAPKTPENVTTPREQEVLDRIAALDAEADGEVIEPFDAVNQPDVTPTGTAGTAPTGTDGWKLHLNPVPGSEQAISDYLTEQGVPHKVGRSGEQVGKGMTVYVGAKDAADALAKDLNSRFDNALKDAEGDVLNDDTPLAGKVWGRFDISSVDPQFHQYGKAGVPVQNDDMANIAFSGLGVGTPERAAAFEEARNRADAILKRRYGAFYTGTPVEQAVAETTAGKTVGIAPWLGFSAGIANRAPVEVATKKAPTPTPTPTPVNPAAKAYQDEIDSLTATVNEARDKYYELRQSGASKEVISKAANELLILEKDYRDKVYVVEQNLEALTNPAEPTPTEQAVAETTAPKPAAQRPVADNPELPRAKQQVEYSGVASVAHLTDYMGYDAKTAEDLLSQLETQGVVSAPDANGKRQVLTKTPTAQAAPRTAEEEADFRAETYIPTEAEAFPAGPEAQALPRNVVPFTLIPPSFFTPIVETQAAPKGKAKGKTKAKAKLKPIKPMTTAEATAFFDQVVIGAEITSEEALAFPDKMLENEPQPKLIPLKKVDEDAPVAERVAMKRAKEANRVTMQSWQARQAARRKIAAVKKTAQVERQAAERRAARAPETPGFEPPIAQTSADENTLTRVDPLTLQPIAAPRISPDRFTLGRRNRRFTGKPTKAWVEFLQDSEARNPTGDNPAQGRTYAAAIKDFFETRADAAFRKYRGYYIQATGGVALVDDTTVHTDKEAVLNLLKFRGGVTKGSQASAAHQFFSRFPNIMEALQEIGAVSVFDVPGQPVYTPSVAANSKTPQEDALDIREGNERAKLTGADKFYERIKPADAAKARKWVTNNLSRKAQIVMNQAANSTKTEVEAGMTANAVISAAHEIMTKEDDAARKAADRQINEAVREVKVATATNLPPTMASGKPANISRITYRKGETRTDAIMKALGFDPKGYDALSPAQQAFVDDAILAYEAEEQAGRDFVYGPTLKLLSSAVDTMALPLQPSVVGALRAGNLRDALVSIGLTHPNPLVARIAMKLSEAVGTTKTRVVDDLRADDGTAVAGLFNPATNELLFDSKTGLNAHVVMHEMGHAALSHTLADASHPTTQAVQEVYDSVKGLLSTYYGSQSLQEFAAEALTNREFRGELARLHPNGDPISAWTRFTDAVRNFLRTMVGKPRKMRGSALSTLDNVLTASIAPAPAYRDAGALYMASSAEGASDTMRVMGRISESIKSVTPGSMRATADQLLDVVGNDPLGTVSDVIMGSRNLPMLVEMARAAQLPAAVKIETLINKMTAEQVSAAARLSGMQKIFEETRDSADPAEYERFKLMMNKGNLASVRASRPRGTYPDRDQNTTHQELNALYRSLSPKLRATADALWDNYPRQNQVLMGAITDSVNQMESVEGNKIPDSVKSSLLKSFQARLLASSTMLDGYQPMVREGSYWLRYAARATPNSPPETIYQTFATNAERSRAIAALANMPEVEKDASGKPDYDATPRLSISSFRRAPDGSFVRGVLTLLDQANVDDPTKERFMAMVIELMPESSFAKSLQRREGFPGFEQDPVEAFRIKAFQTARQTERLRYSRQINEAVQELTDEWNRGGIAGQQGVAHNPGTKALVDELLQRAAFAVNPPSDQFAEKVTRATFAMTLGWNISSVVVQTGTLGVVVAPNLAARYKTAPTMRAISMATKAFALSGLNRLQDMPQAVGGTSTVKVRAAPSIDNPYVVVDGEYTVRTDRGFTPEETAQLRARIPLIKAMAASGELSRSLYYDSFGFETAGRKKTIFSRVSTLMGGAFQLAERMNRQVTAVATYDLHYAKLKAANPTASDASLREEAANEAVRLTRKLNGGATLNDAPRWTQQGIGRIAGMFRNYGLHMTHMQLRYMKEASGMEVRAFQNKLASGELPSTPENLKHLEQLKADAKIALKATLGMWGASFLLAGVAGVPMFNAVAMMVNALLLDDDEDDFETLVRKHIGEGWYKGWLTEATGMDISGRIGLSGLLLRADRFNSNPSEADTFMNYFGGPAWATGVRVSRGIKELLSGGDVQRGVEQMLPAAFSSFSKALRYANEGMTTRRGDPVVDDVTTGDIIGQMLGFAPTAYTMNQERNQVLKRIDTSIGKERTKLMKSVYMALRKGDSEERAAALKKIAEFNRRNPRNPIEGVDLMRSMKQHQQTTEDMYNGIMINPANRAALMQNARDWDQGWNMF